MKKKNFLTLIILICMILSACGTSKENIETKFNKNPISKDGFLLDTFINIKVYDTSDNSVLEDAFKLIDELDKNLSSHNTDSDIYKLNNSDNKINVKLNTDALNCIKKAIHYSELSNGLFDPTIGSVSLLWDFSSNTKKNQLPNDNIIKENIDYVDYKNISINNNLISIQKNSKIDLGAIAKGYIADRVKEFLSSKGVKSAIINLGGNVLTIGKKGEFPFKIGIQNPEKNRNEIIGTIKVDDKSVVTSGTYERFIEVNGKKYHHILNPKTGYPEENDILQTTVVSNYSVDGDALSTTIFLLGKEKGIELINNMPETEACFVLKNGEIIKSNGFDKLTEFEKE